jgi:hypothetical protein
MKKTSEVDILNDGFRWQKYGQKDIISKDTLTLGDIAYPSYLISYIGLSMNVMVKHLLKKNMFNYSY